MNSSWASAPSRRPTEPRRTDGSPRDTSVTSDYMGHVLPSPPEPSPMRERMKPFLSHPFDDDKLREECGVFGVIGVSDASNFVALGLHALQHRGQEAGGIVCHHPDHGFNSARRFGYVRDNFTKQSLMETLPGPLAIGHVRYSTAGSKGQ